MDKIAVLIPCYNEEKTIEKVVRDWKKELRKQLFMFMIITQKIVQLNWQKKQARLYVMSMHREKEM